MNSMIRVGIADDHELFREGIRMILATMAGIEICLEAGSGRALLEQLKTTHADIVLLDIEMKDMNGMDTLNAIRDAGLPSRVIVLSMHAEPRMMSYMMERGASAYLKKDVNKEELELAIHTVYDKGTYFTEAVSKALLTKLTSGHKTFPGIELSPREKEVLELICQEYTSQEIADRLFISERTVEGHRKNLCLKLDVKNIAGLVKKALLLNLIQ